MRGEQPFPVVAGTSVRCAVGTGTVESFDRLVAGDSGIGPLVGYPAAQFGVRHAYQVDDPPRSQRERLLASRLLVATIQEAVEDAGLATLRDVPVIVGTGLGETRTVESAWLDGKPLEEAHATLVDGVRMATDAEDVQVFSNACSASLYALAAGCDLIAAGTVEAVVVAGVDVLSQSMFGLLDRVHLDPPTSVRPFDVARRGVLMGDGAAAVVLRRSDLEDTAARRREQVAVRAVALGCDAFHPTAPDDTGIEHTVRAAHDLAGIVPGQIDAVYAHGTGTVLNDQAEAAALARVLPSTVPVTSVKGATGHTSGASGLFSLCMAVQTLRRATLPGTLGLTDVDPAAADLSLSARARRLDRPRLVQVDAFGFGGLNAVAIVEREPDAAALARAWSRPTAPPVGTPAAGAPLRLSGPYGSVELLATGLCFPDDGVHDVADLGPGSVRGGETFDLRAAVGRKGFRTMTPATRVATVAAGRAVADRWPPHGGDRQDGFFDDGLRRGIVAASAHGSTGTVCDVAGIIESEGVPATSALQLPNASRNVLAATVAIRLGVTGPCLTMDSGAAGGWDALRWAVHLIESGRCDEVLCLVAEAPAESVAALTGDDLVHGAVALLLGRPRSAHGAAPAGAAPPSTAPGLDPMVPGREVRGTMSTVGAGLAVAAALAVPHPAGTLLDGPTGVWAVTAP